MKDPEEQFFLCECNSPEHQLLFSRWAPEEGAGYGNLYVQFHLCRKGVRWWRRIWYAIRYMLGRDSRYGAWCEFCLRPEDAERMRDMLNRFIV
jgi:hypothetical protein